MTLSERVRALEETSNPTAGMANDLRVIEMHVSRAEALLLRYERANCSWTKPDLLLQAVETQ